MGLGTDIRVLRAGLRRLEDAAGKSRRNCLYCRLNVGRRLADPKRARPRPEGVVRSRCEECGSEYWVDLSGHSERDREAYRLYCSYTREDYFTDPKAHALIRWVLSTCGDKEEDSGSKPAPQKRAAKRRGAGKLAELTARYDALADRKVEALRAKYGKDPFPELTRRAESILGEPHEDHDANLLPRGHQNRPEFDDLERREREHLVSAAMERFVFGRVWPETEEAVARLRARIDELLEWPRSQRRLEEARRREEDARRLEEQARRREEEERRLEEEEAQRREQEEARLRKEEERGILREFLLEILPPGLRRDYPHLFLEPRGAAPTGDAPE